MSTATATQTATTAKQRAAARRAAGCRPHDAVEVKVIPEGHLSPRQLGASWYYETTKGERIHHPSAYAKRGWSNMCYVGSTRRVVVGQKWLEEHVG